MAQQTSAVKSPFKEPEHFRKTNTHKWFCALCTPPVDVSQIRVMTEERAIIHESSVLHQNNLQFWHEWSWEYSLTLRPPPASLDRADPRWFECHDYEKRTRYDQLKYIIPFWLRNVEAAARGEDLRFEDLYEELDIIEDTPLEKRAPPPNPYAEEEAQSNAAVDPDGWQEVDTNAEPPRSIWVHPYEDNQYLNEHPEVREKLAQRKGGRNPSPGASSSPTGSPLLSGSEKHRGFFGKLKDKAIGTKEEREAERQRKFELEEQRRQQNMEMEQRRMYQSQQAAAYAYPQQQYAQQGPYYEQQQMYAQPTSARRHGMGGTALPLLGGMVGGLLLADVLDGGFGNSGFGGGFGGGGFGGGGFGGGGFGGGDFGGGGFGGGGGFF
ncbi:hypothetical protein FISHEDRAFT_76300 [Fistulina hepatica ATCC 64428]|uniref:Uncharacterized protein n=1 Tax=Fistulina hepatica ATCC 64428 TaxID=1128425 RepID=A0A0D7A747_9AGAR|nr:hypothetical protein FISHEDRAFT_76300 [Fistulina hepatica ATCC 64428]